MALVTYQVQGSYATFPGRLTSWRKGLEAKRFFSRPIVVKRKSSLSVRAPLTRRSKGQSLRILSFKGKDDESGGRTNGSKSAKNYVDYSYVPHNVETVVESTEVLNGQISSLPEVDVGLSGSESVKMQNGQISSSPEADLRLTGSLAIQKLFESWFTLLHAPSPELVVDRTLEGPVSPMETQNGQISSLPEAEARLSGSRAIQKLLKSWFTLLHVPSPELVVDRNLVGAPSSRETQNGQNSSLPEAEVRLSGSRAVQILFKSWLTLLHALSPELVVDRTLEGAPSSRETSKIKILTLSKERGEILKAVWCHFMILDASIRIPLMIFVPLYMVVNLKYGAEASKELTPFWIAAPLLVAVYIRMLKLLCALYTSTFRRTVKVLKNLPTYVQVPYAVVVRRKLIQVCIQQTLEVIRNLPKRVEAWWEVKQVEWEEKLVDFTEYIWPYYCRTIRLLKRSNVIK